MTIPSAFFGSVKSVTIRAFMVRSSNIFHQASEVRSATETARAAISMPPMMSENQCIPKINDGKGSDECVGENQSSVFIPTAVFIEACKA